MKRTIRCNLMNKLGRLKKLCFGLTGFRLSSFHSSTIGLDRQKTSRGFSAFTDRARTERHEQLRYVIVTTRQEKTEFALGGIRQGIRDEIFDAEPEVTQGSHVEEEYSRSDCL